jgi:hypothetical protein
MKTLIAVTWSFAGSLCLALSPVLAVPRPEPLPLAVLSERPVIDGRLDETAWREATVLEGFVETWPGDNTAAPRATRVLVGVDAERVYLAVDARDDAGAVRATLARRDDVLADDHVRFLFDTFDDRRRAYVVALNPFGIAQDGLWSEGTDVDYTFDLVFESRGEVREGGYTVEMALPLSSVRSSSSAGRAWGLHVFRMIRHLGNTELSWRPLERGRSRVLEQSGRIAGFVEAPSVRRFEIIPSFTVERADGADADIDDERSLGGTMRLALGNALVVDAAIEPDFAQVEADQPVVTANQRFPLFFPEKRPFFLEGTEIFASPLSLVNTRTIADPEVALKATGRSGATTFGALVARDRALDGDRAPGRRDLAILRAERSGGTVDWGVLVTALDTSVGSVGAVADERQGMVASFDLAARPAEDRSWRLQVAGTQARRPFYDPAIDRSVLRDGTGLGYSLSHSRTGRNRSWTARGEGRSPDYVADLGFTRQVDLHRWALDLTFAGDPRSAGALRSVTFVHTALLQTDWDARPTYAYLYPQLTLKLAHQQEFGFYPYYDYLEIREEEFGARRGPTQTGAFFGAPKRATKYHGLAVSWRAAPSERLSVSSSIDRSWHQMDFDFGGGARYPRVSPAALADPTAPLDPGPGGTLYWDVRLDLKPTDSARLTLEASRSLLRRDDNGLLAYDQRLLTARLNYQFTRSIFARLRTSYDSLAGKALVEALAAWTPSPGTAIYIGTEEPQLRDPRDHRPGEPFAGWRRSGRTSFVKLSYRWGREF